MSARIVDEVRCPECRSATLVTEPIEGIRYRYCSYVSCAWGTEGHDVVVSDTDAANPTGPAPTGR